jgi:hypothetical protein
MADVLPPGQKAVPVCVSFSNVGQLTDSIAVIVYEAAPGGGRVKLSRILSNECLSKGYKFNTFSIFGMLPSKVKAIESATYTPYADPNAYSTNIGIEMGVMYVPSASKLKSVENVYKIVKLDTAKGKLYIEPARTEKIYDGSDSATVLQGTITRLADGDKTEAVITGTESVFTDVGIGSPYFQSLKYLKDLGIVAGYPDGSFKPQNTINRAEFTKIIAGAVSNKDELGKCMNFFTSKNSPMSKVFSDVSFAMVGGNDPEWFFDYVCVAKHRGFVDGYKDGTFRPTQKINFVEAAKIITKALDYQMSASTVWYETYVKKLDALNAIPLSIKSFSQELTRGEMAEMIYRLKSMTTDLPSMSFDQMK